MLVVANCKFINRSGRYSKAYGYSCDPTLAKTLLKGDWLVVTNAGTVYTCARFHSIQILIKPQDIAMITQRVVLKIPGRHAAPQKQSEYIDI